MRRTVTAIVAFFVWILFVGLSLTIMDSSLLLGIFAMAAFTIVILFGYVMIDDIMADLDEEEAEEKKRKKAREIKPYYDEDKDRITVKVRFRGYQWEEEKPIPAPKIKKVKVKKKKLSSDFAPQEREYRGKEGINFQKLD
jgi:hypothetical protein